MCAIRTKKMQRHQFVSLALDMISAGFHDSIIQVVTGLSDTMIRSYRQEKQELDEGIPQVSGRLKSAARIVDNRLRIIHAGIIMNTYIRIADDPRHLVDIRALMRAYEVYIDIYRALYQHGDPPISINDAYVLARDYRCGDGSVELMRCQCGTDYVQVSMQRIAAGCPLCSMKPPGKGVSAEVTDAAVPDIGHIHRFIMMAREIMGAYSLRGSVY